MSKTILPGLIDPHVHLRDPGQTEKEDFYTGTNSALAGGFTTILDMPNNKAPITTSDRLGEKIKIAKGKIICDIGFYFGSQGDNIKEFEKIRNRVFGLKLYLNETTGNYLVDEKILEKIATVWSNKKLAQTLALHSNGVWNEIDLPILVHAEDDILAKVLNIFKKIKKPFHICHISLLSELKQIIKAKNDGLSISCGITPHHLFLTENDAKVLGPFGKMKPSLKTKKDVDFLWKNLKYIDVIESDHAPHTIEDKTKEVRGANKIFAGTTRANDFMDRKNHIPLASQENFVSYFSTSTIKNVPNGVPGLETTLPLLLTAVSEKRLTIDEIVRLCHDNPSKIFRIKQDPETKIEVDPDYKYIIENKNLFTKCGWSPFNSWKVQGKVKRVYIRGNKVFEDGKILVEPGFGRVIISL